MFDIIGQILEISKLIKTERDRTDVLCSVMEEVGELGTEVRIAKGSSYKVAGEDGVLGESVDAILALVDMIYVDNTDITVGEIHAIIYSKLNKWQLKESQAAAARGESW